MTVPLLERFNSYIGDITESGCILWAGNTNRDGYGVISSGTGRGKMLLAHRVAFELAGCTIPEGLCVMHDCDNRICVNPEHLSVGTWPDNIADMVAKRRHAVGERNAGAKLKESDVYAIRGLLGQDVTGTTISRLFNVSMATVSLIKHRKIWNHLS